MSAARPLTQVAPPLRLSGEAATARLARRISARVGAGDTLLLDGPIGAGKSTFARALIQSRLAALGRAEDVPSPTYTLVQTYDAGGVEILHADLFRLKSTGELVELGLDDAFGAALCLIEWPDRLGNAAPPDALWLEFQTDPAGGPEDRFLTLTSADPGWVSRLAGIESSGADDD